MLMVMILGMVKVTIFEMAMMIMMVMMTETSMVKLTLTVMVIDFCCCDLMNLQAQMVNMLSLIIAILMDLVMVTVYW